MNLLVTLNANYLLPLKVMLKSLFLNNENQHFTVYLMHSELTDAQLADLDRYVSAHGHQLAVVDIPGDYFRDAPILMHYTKEMYYRLLAFRFLPEDLERILYLDPDTLVINPISELYHLDLDGYLYAAAYHDLLTVKEINRLRLKPYPIDEYYNSGVLLMNLDLQRKLVDEQAIFEFVEKNRNRLILPDQDILNALYGKRIKTLDEKLYNYDARYYRLYKLLSNGLWDMDYVLRNTVIIHFCGKRKPWKKDYSGKFHSLYKHYERMVN